MSFIISNPLSELIESIAFCQHPQQQQHNASFNSSGQIIITSDIEFLDARLNSINNCQITSLNSIKSKFQISLKMLLENEFMRPSSKFI